VRPGQWPQIESEGRARLTLLRRVRWVEGEIDYFYEETSGELVMSEKVINADGVLLILMGQSGGHNAGKENPFHPGQRWICNQIFDPASKSFFVAPRQRPQIFAFVRQKKQWSPANTEIHAANLRCSFFFQLISEFFDGNRFHTSSY